MEIKLTSIFDWIGIATTGIAFFVSIRRGNKKYLYPITLYIMVSFANNIILKAIEYFLDPRTFIAVSSIEIYAYSVIELFLVTYFIFKTINSKTLRNITISAFPVYIVFSVFTVFLLKKRIISFLPPLFGIENFLITIPCLFYFYELAKSDLNLNFKSNDIFIAIFGIFTCFSIATPYYLFNYILFLISKPYPPFYLLFNLTSYSFLFIVLTKAYLCPYQEQKS